MGRINQEQYDVNVAAYQEQIDDRLETEGQQRGEPAREAGTASAKELMQMLERQQYCCAISGLPLTPDSSALDHIVAVVDGGVHSAENLQWLHVDINRMKGTLSQQRFEQLVLLMAANINPREAMQSS